MKKQKLYTQLKAAEGQKILLLGREGLFTVQEIERFLKKYHITVVKRIEEGVVASIEHHRLNPVEEMLSEDAYAHRIPSFRLELLEQLISENMKDDEILMAIKLTDDQQRVLRMIENPYISDSLFVKLLEIYRWHEEEDHNDDRSVVIATLTRYIEVTPAEQDQLYSTLTLKRLVREATDPKLLHALTGFPNYTFRQKNQGETSLYEVVATSGYLDETVIARLLRLRNPKVDMYLAANPLVPLEQLQEFAERNEVPILEALAANEAIDDTLFELLLEKSDDVVKLLLWYQPIDTARYKLIIQKLTSSPLLREVGKNTKLSEEVQSKVIKTDNSQLLKMLAANPTLPPELLEEIYAKGIEECYDALASNPNLPLSIIEIFYELFEDDLEMMHRIAANPQTPVPCLKRLYQRDEVQINKGLAANPGTPIEILDILKIDTRMRNALSQNEVFIEHHNTTKVII